MIPFLFLQSECDDPFLIYQNQLLNDGLVWDNQHQTWGAFHYEHVKYLLNHPCAQVPSSSEYDMNQLNSFALKIANRLARLNGPPIHEIARKCASIFFELLNDHLVGTYLEKEFANCQGDFTILWVEQVCKRLPIWMILSAARFKKSDAKFIMEKIESLTALIVNKKTIVQIEQINSISESIYSITA
ncbi:MAG TPA: hypothetical protein VFV08_16975, partial [Puia sp.]|nr:hypothetical protein [Puia sp.]